MRNYKKEANGNSGVEKNNKWNWDFLGVSVVKNLPFNARDSGSIPGRETKPMHHNYWAPHHNDRTSVPQQNIPPASPKTQHNQTDKFLRSTINELKIHWETSTWDLSWQEKNQQIHTKTYQNKSFESLEQKENLEGRNRKSTCYI